MLAPVVKGGEVVHRIARASQTWGRNIANVQITEATPDALALRILESRRNVTMHVAADMHLQLICS
ncbi:MAG TPA: hypothetical protein VNZ93_07135 [Pseudorhodoplanes sp.]|nr:hypothetical protein [Pseudorhodoplanes sp.]